MKTRVLKNWRFWVMLVLVLICLMSPVWVAALIARI